MARVLRPASAIAKWGNSTGIRLSKEVLKAAHLVEGDRLEVEVEAPGVIRMRVAQQPATLEELVSRITDANRHEEISWGPARGKEIW